MLLNRRDFLKLAAAATATAVIAQYKMEILNVFAEAKDYVHICWLDGAGCTGCSVSFVQATNPDLTELLTGITVGNSGLPIALPDWMYVIHPASGSLAGELIEGWIKHPGPGKKILIVEGSVQREGFCEFGGSDFRKWVEKCSGVADPDHIVAFGSCSAFGGIPRARGNVTGAMSVQDFLKEVGMGDKAKEVINLPRCPGHPDSLVLTLTSLIEGIKPELDKYNRPRVFYGKNMHEELCPYRPYYDRGVFANYGQSERGCRFKIGCKGPVTFTDCALRKWNRISYCVEVGAPCIACSEPDFPDGNTAPFFTEITSLPTILGLPSETWGMAFVGAAAAAVGVHAARKVLTKKGEKGEE